MSPGSWVTLPARNSLHINGSLVCPILWTSTRPQHIKRILYTYIHGLKPLDCHLQFCTVAIISRSRIRRCHKVKFGLQYKTIFLRQIFGAGLDSSAMLLKSGSFSVLDSLYFSHVYAISCVNTESQNTWVDFLHLLLSLLFIHGVEGVLLRGPSKEARWLVRSCGFTNRRPSRDRYSPHASLQKMNMSSQNRTTKQFNIGSAFSQGIIED